MEAEVRCAQCLQIFTKPILLHCYHSLCFACATNLQTPITVQQQQQYPQTTTSETDSQPYEDFPDIDRLSILSEADSGVVCSRPSSYSSFGSMIIPQQTASCSLAITCPVPHCRRLTFMEEAGAKSLTRNRILESIAEKHRLSKGRKVAERCQLCAESPPTEAACMCEQCEIFYCQSCRDSCHPMRGPLAKHSLVSPTDGRAAIESKTRSREMTCKLHDENLSMYCSLCATSGCYVCLKDGHHMDHDVHAIGSMCKTTKAELHSLLKALSEKAKFGSEILVHLRNLHEQIQGNCLDFEASVVAQIDRLIEIMRQRKDQLLRVIELEKEKKSKALKCQINECSELMQGTTGLIQFCIEAIKEADADQAGFLQISPGLVSRVSEQRINFDRDLVAEPRESPDFDMALDAGLLKQAIESLDFYSLKDVMYCFVPGAPQFVNHECSAQNNTLTLSWAPHPGSVVDSFVLELDDANKDSFRQVYCGPDTMCTVDGLHFDTIYTARVRAFGRTGYSEYSQTVSLHTADVARFGFDPAKCHPDIRIINDGSAVECAGSDDRVCLATVGFSRGIHYWEVSIDHHDGKSDPAIGIARFDCAKDVMLGKDSKSWAMYVDSTRSWFLHASKNSARCDRGVTRGSHIGVLLDLDEGTLCYYINDRPHGPVAFTGLKGVFYPAVSLNRSAQLSFHTGLDPPSDDGSNTENE